MAEELKNNNTEIQNDKSFGISSWAINNTKTVYVIMAIIVFGGISAFFGMPRENFPEIIENKIYISSVYPGTAAADVEKFITEPLEDEIKDISGIKEVESTSFNDYAMTIVEFEDEVPNELAKTKVKDKVDIAKAESDWPTLDTGSKVEPNVFDLNISEETPTAYVNLTGNYTADQLKDFAERLQDDFEDLSEIKETPISGVDDKEVLVALDVYKMTAAQVSFSDVSSRIGNDNKTVSAGNFINDEQKVSVRVVGEIKSPEELLNIVVKQKGGAPVYLKDIASVKFQEEDRSTYARLSGKPVITLSIKKRSGKNMIEANEKVAEIVKEAQATWLPKDVNVSITNDQAPKTQNQVDDLVNNIVFGMILVVSVLLFFLGLRNASFVGLAIPLSMLMSLLILQSFGSTLNTMVLFGLVMGLGMLVDNGIVVVENVFTLVNQGYSKKEAAIQGVGEIAWPIIASTATTLAAFFPLGLWPGTMGKFMMYFPMTLSVVLGSSLFVALIINSMLTSEFMQSEDEHKRDEKPNKKKMIRNTIIAFFVGALLLVCGYHFEIPVLRIFGNLTLFFGAMIWVYQYFLLPQSDWFQEVGLPWLENFYQKILTWCLGGKRPWFIFGGTIALLIFSFMLLGIVQPKVEFFPDNQPNTITVYIEYPEGTDIEKTNRLTLDIEQKVIDVLKQYTVKEEGEDYNFMVEAILSQVGQGANNPNTDTGSAADIPHKAKITVSLREFKYRRGVKSSDVKNQIYEAVQGYAGAAVTVEKDQNGPPAGYPINIQLFGDDYEQMMDEAEKIQAYITRLKVPGVEQMKIDVSRDVPELQVNVNRELAGSMGITNQAIGGTLRQSVFGIEVSRYRPDNDDDDYPINIRLKEDQRYDNNLVFNQPVTFTNPDNGNVMQVPISSVITEHETQQFSKIKREDYKRTITVYSNVLEGYNANEVVDNLEAKLKQANLDLPNGITYAFTGEMKEQAKNMAFLSKALLYALIGILLIVVLQFNSISKPIIIMISIILSFIGVFLGLIVMGDTFVIMMTMMGIISLAGIVVNNAIVLIDYTQLLLDRKKKELGVPQSDFLPYYYMRRAIIAGGKSRLRPVLLTAITTVLGLVPLAIGLNIDFYSLLADYNPNIYMGGDNVIFWGPLAKTIIYGLIFATFLTLVVVPILQLLINRIKFRTKYGKHGKTYPFPELFKNKIEK